MTPEEIVKRLLILQRKWTSDAGDLEATIDLVEQQAMALEEAEEALRYAYKNYDWTTGEANMFETVLADIRSARGIKDDA